MSHFVISWWIFYYSNSVWSKIFQSPLCSVLSTATDRVQCVCQARTVLRLSAFYEYVILPPSNCSIFNFEIFSINIASSQASGMLWNFRQQFAWNVWMFISEILSSTSGRACHLVQTNDSDEPALALCWLWAPRLRKTIRFNLVERSGNDDVCWQI